VSALAVVTLFFILVLNKRVRLSASSAGGRVYEAVAPDGTARPANWLS